jgi:hypothetical protein
LAADPVVAGKQLAEAGSVGCSRLLQLSRRWWQKGSGARFPSIAGHPEIYLLNRLHDFQARASAKTMTAISATLTDRRFQIIAVIPALAVADA